MAGTDLIPIRKHIAASLLNGGPNLGFVYEGSCYFGSILN